MLDAARYAAEDALLDRTLFVVNPKAYAEFLARLDASPRPSVRLRRSLQTPELCDFSYPAADVNRGLVRISRLLNPSISPIDLID